MRFNLIKYQLFGLWGILGTASSPGQMLNSVLAMYACDPGVSGLPILGNSVRPALVILLETEAPPPHFQFLTSVQFSLCKDRTFVCFFSDVSQVSQSVSGT